MSPVLARKKPVEVWVMQWDGADDTGDAIQTWTGGRFEIIVPGTSADPLATAEVFDVLHSTWVLLRTGDWLIKGVQGEFYPCRDSVFAETYDLVGPVVAGAD